MKEVRTTEEKHIELLEKHEREIDKLWDAHKSVRDSVTGLKEEQIKLREHMSAQFGKQDERLADLKNDLREEIKTGDANNEKRNNELRREIKDTMSGLAASNPIWFTVAVTLVMSGVAVLATWLAVR